MAGNVFAVACLVFGFGFVVFFHELGHFLAAKWVGIKVEQFAVGFGQALLAYRKGIGIRVGSTSKEYEQRVRDHMRANGGESNNTLRQEAAADAIGLGETEYRLNWIPLGGYVKMLGQDDLNPNAQSEHPRAYNRKSISARMLVVSAGVIMNVILAAIMFMAVFLMGFDVQPPVIGVIHSQSPAQQAGLQIGDRVRWLDGTYQHDFNKLQLNSALVNANTDVPITIERNGKEEKRTIRPQRDPVTGFLSMGVGLHAVRELKGVDPAKVKKIDADPAEQLMPGDVITSVNGRPVNQQGFKVEEYIFFDEQLQESYGKPVLLTVRDLKGQERPVKAEPTFEVFFGDIPFNIAGMQPRPVMRSMEDDSPAKDILKPGDVVTKLKINGDTIPNLTVQEFISVVGNAGANGWHVDFVVERDGKPLELKGVVPNLKLGKGRRGLGVHPVNEDRKPVMANTLKGSPAERSGIPRGALITHVDGQPVSSWFDVHRLVKTGSSHVIAYVSDQDDKAVKGQGTLELDEAAQQATKNVRYTHRLILAEHIEPRQTDNPFKAAGWGVTETRDLLLQFYITLHRLTQGSVSATNLMGPIGIVHAGSMFAFKGWDWLIWFLAMISANLAVVNFLPIPIVDGGLFTFLIIEKISGKPLSPRMQTVAQLVGLAIILSVFLLVTYQDIMRLPIF